MSPKTVASILLSLVFVTNTLAQPDSASQTHHIDELAWMTGHWRSESEGQVTEEIWMAPAGQMMPGVNRSVSERGASFEALRIVQSGDQVTYLASPGGGEPTPFELISVNEQKAVFENKENDFPQRIVYEKQGEHLHARIEGMMGGRKRTMAWTWDSVNSDVARKDSNPKPRGTLIRLRTAAFRVKDLEAAKKWYTDVLQVEPYFDQPYYVGFQIGDCELGLDPDVASMVMGNNQPAYWSVRNCAESCQYFLDKGATAGSAPQDVGEGVIVATVIDPFGNTIGLIQEPPLDGGE